MPSKMYVGDKVDLSWTVDAPSGSKNVEWESSNTAVAVVSQNGTITAIAPGKTVITAMLRNGSSTFNLSVSNLMIKELSLSVPNEKMTVGSVSKIGTTISPSNATNQSLQWSSNREDVALVLQDGTVIVLGAGTAAITAEATDGSKKRKTVKITTVADSNAEVDADAIMAQLPSEYKFSVKPGSAAAEFVQKWGLPFAWVELILKEGSTGSEVLAMKKRMQELGYFTAGASLSENYNATTTERVKLFQKVNGLTQTGIADTELLLLLYSDAAKANPQHK